MARDLIIVGAGGFAREMYTFAEQHPECDAKWRLKGFLDDVPDRMAGKNYPHGIIGRIADYQPQKNDLFLVGLGTPGNRRACCQALLNRGAEFLTYVHPTVTIGRNVTLGTGVILLVNVILTCDISVGDFSVFLSLSGAGHDAMIGSYCQVSSGCEITGAARLGDDVLMGAGARIMPKVSVGNGAVIGAGSIVLHAVEDGETVFGSPAKSIWKKSN